MNEGTRQPSEPRGGRPCSNPAAIRLPQWGGQLERVGLATSGPKRVGGFRVILEEARSWHRTSSLVAMGPRNQTISDHLAELEVAHPSSHFSKGNEAGMTAVAAAVADGERPYPPVATPCGSGGASGLSQEERHLERGGSER